MDLRRTVIAHSYIHSSGSTQSSCEFTNTSPFYQFHNHLGAMFYWSAHGFLSNTIDATSWSGTKGAGSPPPCILLAYSEIEVGSWHHLEVLVMHSFNSGNGPRSTAQESPFSHLLPPLPSPSSEAAPPLSDEPLVCPRIESNFWPGRILGSWPKSWASMSKRRPRLILTSIHWIKLFAKLS